MASHKIFAAKGFTLVEVVIVIGILGAVVLFASILDFSSFFGSSQRAEVEQVATLLHKARADSMSNIGEAPHGLAIFPSDRPDSYVLFAGADYTADPDSHEVFKASYKLEVESAPTEIVFAPLSAATNNKTITLKDPNRQVESEIHIYEEGTIDW
jgi:prepilin-type N-terminal cleavage/methylation domain-containing protein